MRVINVEDDIFKHNDIKRALEVLGLKDITLVKNEKDAIKLIIESVNSDNPFNLVISDMQFPLFAGGGKDNNAGFKLIDDLKDNDVDIPVIVCSSFNLNIPDIIGCVYYSKNTDLDVEFRKLLQKLPGK